MKCETTAGMLKAALKLLKPVIASHAAVPILGMVKIGGGEVIGTDLDIEMAISLPTSHAEGEALLPFRPLLQLVSAIDPTETLRFQSLEGGVELTAGCGRYVFPTLDAQEFPHMPMPEDMTTVACDGSALKAAIGFVLPFVSNEETRYYLNGVFLSGGVAVATDGHRLGHGGFSDDGKFPDIIVPKLTAWLLSSLPPATSFSTDQQKIRVTMPGARISAKLIDGNFPDWRRVVPSGEDMAKTGMQRMALLRTARRLGALGGLSRIGPFISMLGDGGYVAIALKSREGEIGAEYIAADGAPLSVTYNVNYLAQSLTSLSGERIIMTHKEGMYPAILRGDDDRRFIVMMPATDREKVIDLARSLLSRLTEKRAA